MVQATSRDDVLDWFQGIFKLWKLETIATPADRYIVQQNCLTFIASSFGDLIAYPLPVRDGEQSDFLRTMDYRYATMAYSVMIAGNILAREAGVVDDAEFDRVRSHVQRHFAQHVDTIDSNAERINRHVVDACEKLHGADNSRAFAGVTLGIVGSIIEMTWADICQKRTPKFQIFDGSGLIMEMNAAGEIIRQVSIDGVEKKGGENATLH